MMIAATSIVTLVAASTVRVAVVPPGTADEAVRRMPPCDATVATLAEAFAWKAPAGADADAALEIVLAPCTHAVLETVAVAPRRAPVVIRSAAGGPGSRARVVGGLVVGGLVVEGVAPGSPDARWQAPPPDLADRLPVESREHVRAWILPESARARLAGPVHSGHGLETRAVHSELFVDGAAQIPARWPNAGDGYASIGSLIDAGSVPRDAMDDIPIERRVIAPDRGGVFIPTDATRAARWVGEPDAWAFGFWNWDWSSEQLPIASVDAVTGAVTLGKPHRYGLAARGRFQVTNALSELDREGEYWIDRARGIVCAWLPAAVGECAVSLAEGPFLRLEGARDFTIAGVDFAFTRGGAIESRDGDGVRIEDCGFRALGARAVELEGRGNRVVRCGFRDIGGGGVLLRGGERTTLVRGENAVEDCDFHECARVMRSYSPALTIEGVGNRAARCLFERHPHIALWFRGNDHVIEDCEFAEVVYETGDAGAVYVGRDWTAQGTVIRRNLFHDIRGSDARFQNAVYLDDMSSGITVEDNTFVRCNWGVLVGGGRDNTLRANTFIDCRKAVSWDARGVGWMAGEIRDPSTSTLLRGYAAMPIASEAWRSRYPNLGDYLTYEFGRPVRGVLADSRLVGTPIGRIDDRERVTESGTTAEAIEGDALAARAREAIEAEGVSAKRRAAAVLSKKPSARLESGAWSRER